MTVKAKFSCWNKYNDGRGAEHVMLMPVYGDGTDNAQWAKSTPSGMLQMTITNPAASDYFRIGDEYMLTFDRVEKPAPVVQAANYGTLEVAETYNEQAA